jgi:hypothetical protein
MILNSNIDSFKCLVRRSHFTKNEKDYNEFDNSIAFAIQSVSDKILTFHIMTDYGMLRSRVPISEIFLNKPTKDIEPHFKQLWNCFSENVSVIKYEYLKEKRCEVVLRDKTKVWGTYLMTVDWFSNPYSDEPTDYKCGHIIVADEGYLMLQPNNRIFWKDSNFITNKFPMELKNIKVDDKLISVEGVSDKWVSENGDSFYYDIIKI